MMILVPLFLLLGFIMYSFLFFTDTKTSKHHTSLQYKKTCPLCHHSLTQYEGVLLKQKNHQFILLGCPYCSNKEEYEKKNN